MRILLLGLATIVAGCSPTGDAPAPTAGSNTATGAILSPPAKLVPDAPLASSPAAAEARDVVVRYFKLVEQKDYAQARLLWGNRGADSRGNVAQFADSFRPFSTYVPEVGEPTEIKESNGTQYISVTATAHVTVRKTGRKQDRTGVVLLKRSANQSEPDPEKKSWRIWGTDLRVSH